MSKTLGIMEVNATFTTNIFDRLLDHDLTQICYEIFCCLDSQSIVNCKLVCQSWNKFIKHHFFKLPKGKKCLLQKLNSNFLNEDYKPRYLFLIYDVLLIIIYEYNFYFIIQIFFFPTRMKVITLNSEKIFQIQADERRNQFYFLEISLCYSNLFF